jgi:hypothetical protein
VTGDAISWPALLALGAGHGINPAMGWLFAVALGLQRGSRRAVWGSLGPLALGHAAAIAVTLVAAGLIGLVLPLETLRWVVAALLVGLGLFRLVRSRHITYGGMLVNARELTTWSFLMASAHGAGLMALPLMIGGTTPPMPIHRLAYASLGLGRLEWNALAAAAVHSAGYLLVTGAVAAVVYERVGLRFLRSAWVNLDLLWAAALVGTGIATVAPVILSAMSS